MLASFLLLALSWTDQVTMTLLTQLSLWRIKIKRNIFLFTQIFTISGLHLYRSKFSSDSTLLQPCEDSLSFLGVQFHCAMPSVSAGEAAPGSWCWAPSTAQRALVPQPQSCPSEPPLPVSGMSVLMMSGVPSASPLYSQSPFLWLCRLLPCHSSQRFDLTCLAMF